LINCAFLGLSYYWLRVFENRVQRKIFASLTDEVTELEDTA
jgi:hypothetical protein